jgi:secreted trypsin-like serine protease
MRIELDVLDADLCADTIGHAFDEESMVCAVPDVPGHDTCVGDSGGPILIGSTLDDAAILGVVSWGRGCGAGVPGAYARADRWRQAVPSALARPSRIRSSPYSNSFP